MEFVLKKVQIENKSFAFSSILKLSTADEFYSAMTKILGQLSDESFFTADDLIKVDFCVDFSSELTVFFLFSNKTGNLRVQRFSKRHFDRNAAKVIENEQSNDEKRSVSQIFLFFGFAVAENYFDRPKSTNFRKVQTEKRSNSNSTLQ